MKTPKMIYQIFKLTFASKRFTNKSALVVDYSWKVQALSSEAILVIYLVKVADFWWATYLFSAVQYWRLFPKLVKRNVNVQVLLRLLQISSYSLHSFETNFN